MLLVFLTIVPTGIVAAIAWRINRPGHVRDVEIELSRATRTSGLARLRLLPRARANHLPGRRPAQEEPRGKALAEIARAGAVRLERTGRELTLFVDDPKLRGESPLVGLALLAHLMQRSASIPFERIGVTAPSCQIDLGREDVQFAVRDLAGELLADPSKPTLTLAYRVPGGRAARAASSWCRATAGRSRRVRRWSSRPPTARHYRPGCSTSSSTPTTGWARTPRSRAP